MKFGIQNLGKFFSPRLINRALQAFDRATMAVVAISWISALVVVAVALYTINLSVKAKREVAEATAVEPSIPRVLSKPPDAAEIKPIVTRLVKIFPDIKFLLANDRSLIITAVDGGKFRLWMTVLSYIDTISPQYRWTMKEFCVGMKCLGGPMKAVLVAEKITFGAAGTKK